MAKAKKGDSVKVNYVGRLADGTEFDSSEGNDPLDFTIGKQEVIQGFDDAIIGMEPGETKTVTVPADLAYGPVREELVGVLERSHVPEDVNLIVGHQLEVAQDDDEPFMVMVTELTDTHVTLDANHPLAGKDLTFEITLLEVA